MPEVFGPWGTVTAAGAVLFLAFAFFRALNKGTLWTGKQHAESMSQKDEIIAIQKERGDKLEAGYGEQVRQNGILVDQLETFGYFIKNADRVTGQTPRTGDVSTVEGPGHVRT